MAVSAKNVADRTLVLAVDVAERLLLLVLFSALVIRILPALTAHPNNVLLLVSEALATFLILIRRPGDCASMPLPVAVAFVGTAAPMMVRSGGEALITAGLATSLMTAGLALNIWAKLTLRRSFGVVAANRGVKLGGPYRLVRHPMYLGYFITQLGFLMANPLPWNGAVYMLAWGAQLVRILEEEKLLSHDPTYASYAARVRTRLIPGIF